MYKRFLLVVVVVNNSIYVHWFSEKSVIFMKNKHSYSSGTWRKKISSPISERGPSPLSFDDDKVSLNMNIFSTKIKYTIVITPCCHSYRYILKQMTKQKNFKFPYDLQVMFQSLFACCKHSWRNTLSAFFLPLHFSADGTYGIFRLKIEQ